MGLQVSLIECNGVIQTFTVLRASCNTIRAPAWPAPPVLLGWWAFPHAGALPSESTGHLVEEPKDIMNPRYRLCGLSLLIVILVRMRTSQTRKFRLFLKGAQIRVD